MKSYLLRQPTGATKGQAQYPDALPILFQHLQRPYPDSVLTGIASALAVPESKRWWKPLLELFQANQEEKVNGVKTALASALAAAADDDVVGDVIRLVEDPRHGQHRVILLRVLAMSARQEASEALARTAEDPQLVKEAKVLLRRLARRKRGDQSHASPARSGSTLSDRPGLLVQGEESRRPARCGARRRSAQPESAPSDSARRLPAV